MSYQARGTVYLVKDTKKISEKFQLREFIVEVDNGSRYPQLVEFRITRDLDTLDSYKIGDQISLTFSLRGREWTSPTGEVRYFNSLDVSRFHKDPQYSRDDDGLSDDIPF